MTDAQSLNPVALSRLREWGGDKLVDEMIRLFLANSRSRMDQISGGADSGDVSEAEKGSHSLKSSAANIGAERVQALCAEIENASVAGDLDTVRGRMSALESAYAHAIAQLQALANGTDE